MITSGVCKSPNESPRSKLRGITELNFEDFSEAEANPVASYGEYSSLSRQKQDEIVEKLDDLTEQIRGSVASIEAFAQRLEGEANAALSALIADVYGVAGR
jgi:hypothetical protein